LFPCHDSDSDVQKERVPVRFAVFSDIHNNLEAFKATLEDLQKQNVDKYFCLGDLLGYGPKPIECVDLMMKLCKEGKMEICLLGNHDQATLYDPEGFNRIAEEAVYWTRGVLEACRGARASARWDFIAERPRMFVFKDAFLFVHGSPRSPINEYIFPEDIDEKDKIAKFFSMIPQYCFMGHTHVPGIFLDATEKTDFQYLSYREIEDQYGGKYPLGDQKLMINVGSVGQPRDKNPKSCYAIVQYEAGASDNFIEYHRVEYDVSKTQKEIQEVPALSSFPFLWQRLADGR
jgi:predicted phosphodiesterase